MKILKKIGLVLLVIIVLVCVISLFLPSNVKVERSLVINAPSEVVFEQINNLKNWDKWAVWNQMDPNMTKEYFGPERGSGSGYSWKSENKNVGHGKLTITESKANELINTDLEFADQGISKGGFTFSTEGAGVKVNWSMDMDMGMNPIGKFFGLAMDKMLGPDFEKGLAQLKQVSESMPAETIATETVENVPATDSTSTK